MVWSRMWYDIVWYGMLWRVPVWPDMWYGICLDGIGMLWYGMVWDVGDAVVWYLSLIHI